MSVEADLAALQARVAALEQQEVGGDTITPTYLTIDAQGRVTATFSGHVKASGVDLPEAGNTLIFSGVSAVDWLDQVTQQVREYITGGLQSNLHELYLQSGPGAHGEKSSMTLFHTDGGSCAVGVSADDGLGHNSGARIIDALGGSNFLQIPGAPQQLAIATGSAGPSTGGILTTNHNLGRQPVAVVGLQNTGSIAFNSATPTTITFNCSAAGIGISWIAIG